MPDDGAQGGAPVDVKVVDRRRFTPEGETREDATEEAAPEPGARDAQLAEAEVRIEDLTAKLRAYAAQVDEAKGLRARLEREKERVLDAERARVAQALLDAIDELERAIAAAGSPAPGTPLAALVDGVRLALAALVKRVTEMGAERIPVLGAPFDPRFAEAVDLVRTDDASQDQLVVEEISPGWRVGDRVLRPARVRVARAFQA